MNLSKKKKKKLIKKPFSIIDDDWKKKGYLAFALHCVPFVCVCFRQFKWGNIKGDAICRPIRLFMSGLKTFGFYFLFFIFYRMHCIYPCSCSLTIQLCWLCIRHNISDYRRKWFWVHWRLSMMIPTPFCIHHQRRQDWTSKKYDSIWKQPWYQGMPPLSTSLAAFVTLSLWIYRLIHRMSIYREIKLLGFVCFYL